MSSTSNDYIWQDREIRFDTSARNLENRAGEYIIDTINSVEDTKGNNGERGSLVVTNLRVLWISHRSTRTNLTIGLGTTLSITVRNAKSKLKGSTQGALEVEEFTLACDGLSLLFVFQFCLDLYFARRLRLNPHPHHTRYSSLHYDKVFGLKV